MDADRLLKGSCSDVAAIPERYMAEGRLVKTTKDVGESRGNLGSCTKMQFSCRKMNIWLDFLRSCGIIYPVEYKVGACFLSP